MTFGGTAAEHGDLSNIWIVNNIFSADVFGQLKSQSDQTYLHYDWNLAAFPGWSPGSPDGMTESAPLWAAGDTAVAIDPSSPAHNSALDLSGPWTLDGIAHEALPGMDEAFYGGDAPDRGAVQYVPPTSTPARSVSASAAGHVSGGTQSLYALRGRLVEASASGAGAVPPGIYVVAENVRQSRTSSGIRILRIDGSTGALCAGALQMPY
jgi:hypothetical protein